MLISPLIVSQTALTLLSFDISPLALHYSSIRGAHAIKTLRRAGIGIGPLSDGVCRHYASAEQERVVQVGGAQYVITTARRSSPGQRGRRRGN